MTANKPIENLTRYQSTFLQLLPMNLDSLQRIKQNTVRWCYTRGLFEIHKGLVHRTPFADECLRELRDAPVHRKESTHYGDFTGVIRDLVVVARYERLKEREGRKLQVVHQRSKVA